MIFFLIDLNFNWLNLFKRLLRFYIKFVQLHSFFNMPFGSMMVPWPTLGYCRENRLTHVMLITESSNIVIDLTKWMLPKECSSLFLLKCWPSHPWIGDSHDQETFLAPCAQTINFYIYNYADEASVKKAKYFD